jgi:uncharacterized protein
MKEQRKILEVEGNLLLGTLPEGCRLCMQGLKLVYFMGGDCSRPAHCSWYCPISTERRNSETQYADEIRIKDQTNSKKITETLLYEAEMIDAYGMSITGGDPLSSPSKIELLIEIIQIMKIEKGKDFHIHLYTNAINFDESVASRLEIAELDEIRFHPQEQDFYRIEYAANRKYNFGAEVPVIPTEENYQYLLKLADYLDMIHADFLNLNEFEICESNQEVLSKRNFSIKPGTIATVEGSNEQVQRFLKEFHPRSNMSIHFCQVLLKDKIQLRRRYIRRAEHIRREFEVVTEDGTLLYLQIKGTAKSLQMLYKTLIDEAEIPKKMIDFNGYHGYLDLPAFLQEESSFLEMISEHKIKAGLIEILPFREKENQIVVEYTPLINNIQSKIKLQNEK